MLLVILGFLFVTSIAFLIPFLMGGDDKALASQRGITLAVIASVLYVGAVFVLRG